MKDQIIVTVSSEDLGGSLLCMSDLALQKAVHISRPSEISDSHVQGLTASFHIHFVDRIQGFSLKKQQLKNDTSKCKESLNYQTTIPSETKCT